MYKDLNARVKYLVLSQLEFTHGKLALRQVKGKAIFTHACHHLSQSFVMLFLGRTMHYDVIRGVVYSLDVLQHLLDDLLILFWG